MDDRQTRKYDAAVNGAKALDDHSGDFTGNTPLINKHGALKLLIKKIEDDNKAQLRNKGFASKALTDLHTMHDDAWVMRNLLVEYSKEILNTVMQKKVEFKKSEINQGSVANMKKNAQILHDVVTPAVLADMITKGYKIVAGDVTHLQDDIDAVTGDQGTSASNKADTVAATEALITDFKNMDDLDTSIFNFMTSYAKPSADFYNAVTDAFEPSSIGIRGIALRLVISDSITNTRVHGAVGTFDTLIEKSSMRGIIDFSHQQMKEGNFSGTIKLKGYNDFPISNLAIFNDRFTRVEVKLVKI